MGGRSGSHQQKGGCGCWEKYSGVTDMEGGDQEQNSVSFKVVGK